MNYRVQIPPHVENQILEHALYIAEDSVDRALEWEQEIRSKIMALSDLPKASSLDPAVSERVGHEVRRYAVGNYLVFYFVDDAEGVVVIEGFRHGARLPESD